MKDYSIGPARDHPHDLTLTCFDHEVGNYAPVDMSDVLRKYVWVRGGVLPKTAKVGEVVTLGRYRVQIVEAYYGTEYKCTLILRGQWHRILRFQCLTAWRNFKYRVSFTWKIWREPS